MPQEVSFVFDIASGSVGALAADLASSKPAILWSERVAIPAEDEINPDRLAAKICENLDALVKAGIKASGGRKIVSVLCVYGAPWHVSRHVAIAISRDTPFAVTRKFLDSLVERERTTLIAKIKTDKIMNGPVYVADNIITDIRLNGYNVSDPYKKTATDFKASVFLSLLQKKFVEKIEGVIYKHMHAPRMKHSVLPFVVFTVLRAIMPDDRDFLAVILGEEITEVLRSRGGELDDTVSFPAGKHTLVRILETGGEDYHTRLSLTRLHLDKRAEPEWTAVMEKHVEKVQNRWLDLFNATLKELSIDAPVPKTVLFVADPDSRRLFVDHIKTVFAKENAANGTDPMTALLFDEGPLGDLADVGSGARRDSVLEAESLFANMIK